MLTLPAQKFFAYQDRFFQQVMNLPPVVTFYYNTASGGDAYEIFTGQQTRSQEGVAIHCLYKRQLNDYQRTKYGIDEDVQAVIYVPPQILAQIFGTFQLDYKRINIMFSDLKNDEVYVVRRMVYLEPLYDSCLAVSYHLVSKTKA